MSIVIVRTHGGAVVVVGGWGERRASALMSLVAARELARKLRKRRRAG